MLANQFIIDGEDNEDVKQDRALLKKLKKDLKYQQQDLYSSLPTKRFTRKIKNKPLKSKETIEVEEKRKSLLGAMQKAVQARDRNKYISSHKGNATDFLQHLGT